MYEQTKFCIGGREIVLDNIPEKVFQPNQVTRLVYEAVMINPGDEGIEIGAGIGPGSIFLGQNPNLRLLYAVESNSLQFALLARNLQKHGLLYGKVIPTGGKSFTPLEKVAMADFIVSDASGMDKAGEIIGWYPQGIDLGGEDGAEVTVNLLKEAPRFLRKGNGSARVYFPVIPQFAEGERILDAARASFSTVSKLSEKDFPLREEALARLEEKGYKTHIPLKARGSRLLWTAEVYEARNPKF